MGLARITCSEEIVLMGFWFRFRMGDRYVVSGLRLALALVLVFAARFVKWLAAAGESFPQRDH